MRARLVAALGLLLAAGPVTPVPADAAVVHDVQIRESTYAPGEVRIAKGDTVRWTAIDEGHTVTADDERFDFHRTRTLDTGDRVEWSAPGRDATIGYYCRVHGAPGGLGMAGVIIVGSGGPKPPPPPQGPTRTVPSRTFPTIAKGVAGARPGTVITIRPGVYRESVVVREPNIEIRGGGRTAGAVVLDGDLTADVGLTVLAPGVRISGIATRRYRTAGILWRGAHGFAADRVESHSNDLYGLRVEGSRNGVISRSYVTGAVAAGISVDTCADCGLLVTRVGADGNAAALVATGSTGVVVRDSTFRRNATGIVLRTQPGGAVTAGVHIYGNTLTDNAAPDVRVLPPSERLEVPAGVGVWAAGATHVRVENNTISGHVYAVALTALGGPAQRSQVVGNVVSGSTVADLAWDGIGVGTCFGANARPDGRAPTSEPPFLATAYSCALPVTVGVPHPKVQADIAAHAFRTYYCRVTGVGCI